MQQSNRPRKQEQLRQNRSKGAYKERIAEAGLATEGYRVVERNGRGYDFKAVKVGPGLRNPITGRVEPKVKLVEVKSPKAKLTPLQKKTRRESKVPYEVRRPLL